MESIQNIINAIPNNAYLAIVAAAVVSIALQFTKHWLSIQSDKVIVALLTVFSFLVTAINYATQAVSSNPAVLGQKTAVVMGVTQLVYRFLVKPSYNVVKDAKELRAAKAAAAVVPTPVELPAGTEVVPAPVEAPASPEFQA